MNNAKQNAKAPNNRISIRWGLALAFVVVWLFGNWTKDIGGFKGTMDVSGFPFVFASSGDLIETSFSLTALTYDILIGVAIFAAIVALVPKSAGQRVRDANIAE